MAINRNIIRINPTEAAPDSPEARILGALLLQHRHHSVWIENQSFLVKFAHNDHSIQEVELTNTIVHRKRRNVNKRRGDRYSVQGNLIATGSDSAIYKVACTLKIENKQAVICPNDKRRIIKVQHYKKIKSKDVELPENNQRLGTPAKRLANEAAISQAVEYLHAKPATNVYHPARLFKPKQIAKSYLVTREFPHQTLLELLREDATRQNWVREVDKTHDNEDLIQSLSESIDIHGNAISLDRRLTLTLNLLRALQEQVHDLNLVHLDLKPDNIIVDPVTLEVTIIDFGSSKRSGQKDKGDKISGHSAYIAPEGEQGVYSKNTDKRADVYSMGVIIGNLWGDNERIWKALRLGKPISDDLLFRGMHLNDVHKEAIRTLISSMRAPERSQRITLDFAIQNIKNVRASVRGGEEIPDEIHFSRFKQAYLTEYQKQFFLFRNPFSTMHRGLTNRSKEKRITTMDAVEAHVKKKPKSRSAKVLAKLKKS